MLKSNDVKKSLIGSWEVCKVLYNNQEQKNEFKVVGQTDEDGITLGLTYNRFEYTEGISTNLYDTVITGARVKINFNIHIFNNEDVSLMLPTEEFNKTNGVITIKGDPASLYDRAETLLLRKIDAKEDELAYIIVYKGVNVSDPELIFKVDDTTKLTFELECFKDRKKQKFMDWGNILDLLNEVDDE